jgi:hypothetical protein
MKLKFSLISGTLAVAIGFACYSAWAVPLSPDPFATVARQGKLVETVQWRYCRAVRQQCALRWGWRTFYYYSCAAKRGCA